MFRECKNTKEQGNIGLGVAIQYFTQNLYTVSLPLNDSQDYDLIVEDYLAQTDKDLVTVAHHSIINMISNDYADAAAYERAMEEYRKNPGDVCTIM